MSSIPTSLRRLVIFKHQSKSGIVVVPGKLSDDIPVGTLSSVWKQAKLG